MLLTKIFIIVFAAISLAAVIVYGIDKLQARDGGWRIPEWVLLLLSMLGGGLGGVISMLAFNHKTKHWYFTLLNIIGVLWQIGLIVYFVFAGL